ncbi:MAG: dihydrolipoamide acetyltransferase family protein [Acidobacteria bacterium]|nr:dihydrolipoamide acetyltransferase family protein [Acidobacteriota bacterium]
MADQIEVRMAELADSMTSATLTAWLKHSGDRVTAGEPIAEVETDKTTVEIEAPADGVLADIRVAAGTEAVAVGTVLALVRKGAPGEAATQGGPAENTGSPEAGASVPTPPAGAVDTAEGLPATATAGVAADAIAPPSAGADARIRKPPAGGVGVDAPVGATTPPDDAGPAFVEVPATPLARRMAELAGLDLSGVTGSGDDGRVMKVDVVRLLRSAAAPGAAGAPAAEPAAPARPPAPTSDLPHTDRPLTAMRRITAQRMAAAKQSAPHFYLEIECAVDRLLAVRDEAAAASDAASPAGDAGVPTVNDVVVRAAALALREVPLANSAWTGEAVRVYDRVDLAVAVQTPAGLVTPVVRAADTRTLPEIAAELRRLATDARAGRLQPADYQGGTCTLSNLGMYGVSSLYAILNPPQSCILGVGAIVERPVVRDGKVTAGAMMTVTLSADHRAIDGVTGAELLRALKALLEDPQQVYG